MERLAPPLLALLLLAHPAGAQPRGALPGPEARTGDRRAGDGDGYTRFREFFFHESRPEPLREKYEELFGEPYPEEGFHQHRPFRPFEDVQRFNNAYELRGVAGARAALERGDAGAVLTIELPGTAERALSVRVDEEKIALSVGPAGPPRRWFLSRSEEHVLRMPEGLDPASAEVRRESDRVRINFANQP